MTYSATAFRLLLSAPSDVTSEDIGAAIETVIRWNVLYGQQSGHVVVPTNWGHHAVAKYGDRPQAVLNDQLVDDADIVIALFWYRLGSPTGEAESGTIEEIERAHANGAYVGILRCVRPVPNDVDTVQLQRLREFYERVQPDSLLLSYADVAELKGHVDAILTTATTAVSTRVEAELATAGPSRVAPSAEVWPRIETTPETQSDSRGRIRTRHRHQLVLTNTGSEPARNVRWELELEDDTADGGLPILPTKPSELEALAPGGDAKYNVMPTMGTAPQVRCVVKWEDTAGEHENLATLRFF